MEERARRARTALLDTLGVAAADGNVECEPFRSRQRAIDAPLQAEKILEVSCAFASVCLRACVSLLGGLMHASLIGELPSSPGRFSIPCMCKGACHTEVPMK